jgi:hypothetical protein
MDQPIGTNINPTFSPPTPPVRGVSFLGLSLGIIITAFLNVYIADFFIAIIATLLGPGGIILIIAPVSIFGTSTIGLFALILVGFELVIASWFVTLVLIPLTKVPWQRRYVFVMSVVVFTTAYFGIHVVPQAQKQNALIKTAAVSAIPVNLNPTGATLVRDSKTATYNLQLEDNNINWIETIPVASGYHDEAIQFVFSPTQLIGSYSTPVDFDEDPSISPDRTITDSAALIHQGQAYWIHGGSLYTYNQTTQKGEMLTTGVDRIWGGYNNLLVVSKDMPQTNSEGATSSASPEYSIYNTDTKQLSPLSIQPVYSDPLVDGQYVCYSSSKNILPNGMPEENGTSEEILNLNTNNTTTFNLPISHPTDIPVISDCQGDYIVYYDTGAAIGNTREYLIYQISTGKIVFGKKASPVLNNSATARIIGNDFLYNVNKNAINSIDLSTGQQTVLVASVVDNWAATPNYLTYSTVTTTGEQVYLQPITTGQLNQISFMGDIAP